MTNTLTPDTVTTPSDTRPAAPPEARLARLSTASVRKVLEPEELFDFSELGSGQVIADDLLSVHGLGLDLDADTRARLSREQVAAQLAAGVRFEAVLTAGFALRIAEDYEVTDPRVTYMFHEIAEESRHSRAFARLVEQLAPEAKNPLDRRLPRAVGKFMTRMFIDQPALLMVFVLAGEEIPDLLQKIASEHPDTDPLLGAVNKYHRQEEARHLAYAKLTLPELWSEASRLERFRVRHTAPFIIHNLFRLMIHPGVYRAVGLPGWKTWAAADKTPQRVALRHEATRAVLATLLDTGVLRKGRVPRSWRKLCGVNRHGDA